MVTISSVDHARNEALQRFTKERNIQQTTKKKVG